MVDTIWCDKCRVQIPADNLDTLRCAEWRCPLASQELRMAHAKRVGALADFLAARCQCD
jgi:hypothetical protein